MSSRNSLKHITSTGAPTATQSGDEYFNPTTGKLYKNIIVNGTTLTFVEIPLASNPVNITNATAAVSSLTGALTVAGGAGIQGNLYVGGNITVTGGINANITGVITSATNIAGGTTGQIPYQTAAGLTSFTGPGTSGQLLVSAGAAAPVYTNTSSIYVQDATVSTNLRAGVAGQLVYQSGVNASGFINTATTGNFLQSNFNGAPTWTTTGSMYVQDASVSTNLRAGTTGQLVYQSGVSTTGFVGPGSYGQFLMSSGAAAPVYQSTLTQANGNIIVTSNTGVSTTNSGALQVVNGGVGIGGGLVVGNRSTFTGAMVVTQTTSTPGYGITLTGSIPALGVAMRIENTDFSSPNSYSLISVISGGASTGLSLVSNSSGSGNSGIEVSMSDFYLRGGQTNKDIYVAVNYNQNAIKISGSDKSTIFYSSLTTNSTTTGAVQVYGGIGVNGGGYFNGTVTATNFVGAFAGTVSGTATTATNVAGGTAGQLHYQTGPGATSFVSTATTGNFLQANYTGAPTWTATASIYVNRATIADQILTLAQTASASYYPAFVSANNASATAMSAYTTSSFSINPSTGDVSLSGKLAVNNNSYNTATNTANAIYTSGGIYADGGLTIGANGPVLFKGPVTFSGTATYVLSTNTFYTDNVLELHTPPGGVYANWNLDDGKDIGFRFHYFTNSTDTNAALVLANDSKYLEWYSTGAESASGAFTGTTTYGIFKTGGIRLASGVANGGNTNTGDLQVLGGVGIGGSMYVAGNITVGGTINATVSGTITTATNVAGGVAGQLVYQTAPGATSFVSTATTGNFLQANFNGAPTWTTTASMYVGNSVNSTNLRAGVAGQLHYQSAVDTSGFITTATSGNFLQANFNGAPTWTSTGSMYVQDANVSTNLRAGTAGQLHYQTAANTSGFINTATTGNFLQANYTGAPTWTTTGSMYVYRATVADSASGSSAQINTVAQTASATYYPAFVSANNASATAMSVYTTSTFLVNPATGQVGINTSFLSTSSKLTVYGRVESVTDPSGEGGQFIMRSPGFGYRWSIDNYYGVFRIIREDDVTEANGSAILSITSGTSNIVVIGGTSGYSGEKFAVNGGAYVNGTLTATTFVGAFTGAVTGAASQLNTQIATASGTYYPTFVDSNNASATAELHYTTSTFTINPATGAVGINGVGGTALNLNVPSSVTDKYFIVATGAVNSFSVYENGQVPYINSYNSMHFRANQNGGSGGTIRLTGGTVGIGKAPASTSIGLNVLGAVALDVDDSSTASALMNSNATNNVVYVRAPFNSNPATIANAGAKWGILFSGGPSGDNVTYPVNATTSTLSKAAAIYAVSEDTGAGYNRKVGLTLWTSGQDLSQVERMRLTGNGGLSFSGASGYGTSGQILQSNGDAAPTWVNASSVTAGGAATVLTAQQTANATYYPTFVAANNASGAQSSVYTTSSFVINPATGYHGIGVASPSYTLDVGSAARFTSNSSSRVLYLKQNAAAAGNIIQFVDQADAQVWEIVGRNTQFYVYNTFQAAYSLYINSSTNAVTIAGTSSYSGEKFAVNGGAYVNGTLTATTFVGAFTGAVTGAASQVQTVAHTANASYYPTFVSANNASATGMSVYTTSSFTVNPATGATTVSGLLTAAGGLTQSGGFAYLGNWNSGPSAGHSVPSNYSGTAFSWNLSDGNAEANIWNTSNPSSYSGTGLRFLQWLTASTYRDLMFLRNDGALSFGGTGNIGSAGQVLQSNGAAAPTWVNQSSITSGGTSLTNTYVGYGNSSNLLTGSSNLTWNGTTLYVNGRIQNPGYKVYNVTTTGQGNVNSTYEIMRIGRDSANWSTNIGYEVTVRSAYYNPGGVTSWYITYGYGDAGTISCIDARGGTKHRVYLGAEVTVSGNIKYIPVYVDIPNYYQVAIEVKYTTTEVTTFTSSGQVYFTGTMATGTGSLYSGDTHLVPNGGSVGINLTSPAAKLHLVNSSVSGIGSVPSGVSAIIDSNTNNYLLFRQSADNGTYSGIAMQDNNVGGYVLFGNAGGGGDQLWIGGYSGGSLQYGTSDTIDRTARTTMFNWSSSGLTKGTNAYVVPFCYIGDNAPTAIQSGDLWWESDTGRLKIYYNDGSSSQWVDVVPVVDTSLFFSKSGGAISGPVSINGALDVTGNITATAEITAYYSDRRLKTDVLTIENALVKVKKLNGVTYRPNELAKSYGLDTNSDVVGLFADEVEQVLPQAVKPAPFDIDENGNSKSGENYKTIQYEKVVPLLVEAIKEQQSIIEAQQAKIDQLLKHLGLE